MANQRTPAEGNSRIFLIEADVKFRNHIQDLLSRNNWKVTPFETGIEALDELERNKVLPDLIVSSLVMPGFDGWRFCRFLRSPAGARFQNIPILTYTAAVDQTDATLLASALSVEVVLPLPLDDASFVDKVRRLLKSEIHRQPQRVLIAVEDGHQALTLEETFVRQGYEVTSTPSARTAASLFDITPYHVLLIDDSVPDWSNDKLIETMQGRRPECVCVLMSGEPTADFERKRQMSGKAEYIRKPCDSEILVERCYQIQRERILMRAERRLEERFRVASTELPGVRPFLTFEKGNLTFDHLPEKGLLSLDLADLLDSRAMQSLMDDFDKLTHLAIAILDIEGKILVANGWQTICTHFHRVNPESAMNCLESDTTLTKNVRPGVSNYYRCKNGMWDVSTPIMLADKHLGNIFYGQFFFDDDPPDEEFFRAQARQYGFNEEEYIKALREVPRWNHETVETIMSFYTKLAAIISSVNYKNFQLSQTVDEKNTVLRELRESEEHFSLAMEATNDGIWDGDVVTGQVYYSPNYWRMLGYDPADFVGLYDDWTEHIHPDDRERVITANQDCIANRIQNYEVEYRMKMKDGGYKWILDRGNVVQRDDGGRALRMIGTHMDITERMKAAEALKRTEIHYQALIDQAMDGVVLINPEGKFSYASPAARKMFGYSLDEDLGLEPYEATHPDDLPAVMDGLQKIYTEPHGSFRIQYRFRGRDGSYRWIESNFTNLLSEPSVEAIVINFHDIHEQRLAEEALRQRDKIFTLSFDMLCVAGFDGYFKVLNPAWTRTLGWSTEELLAKPWIEFTHPDDRDKTQNVTTTLIDGQVANQFENRYICKDGSIKWLSWNSYPYPDEQIIIAVARDNSEHKRILAALSESEERYRLLFDQMTEGFALHEIICDEDGKPVDYVFLDVNPAFEKQTGLERSALIGQRVLEVIPLTEPYWIQTYGEVALTGKTIDYENYSAGIGKWFYVTAFCPKHGQFAVTFSDITERKLAAKKLEESEERLRLTLEATQIGFWDWDVKNDLWFASSNYYSMLGYEPNIGYADRREWLERLHPEDREYVNQKIQNVLTRDFDNYKYEARMLHADGSYRWQYVMGFITERDKDSKVSRMMGIRMDINDRKRAEEALKISEERFRSFIENANDIVYQLTPNGIFEYVSPVWTRVLGHSKDEVEGKSFEVFVHPDDINACRVYLEKVITGENPNVIDYRVMHKNGEWRWHTSNGAAIRDTQGKVFGLIGIARDITDRKRDEARLNEQFEELRRWNAATLGRETRILELKKEVNHLLEEAGRPTRYASAREASHD